jgi:Putative peptidoglycan binding domain
MKTFLLLAFSLTTALAPVANAAANPGDQDQDQVKQPKKQQRVPANLPTQIPQPPKSQHNNTVHQQMPISRTPQVNPVTTNQEKRVRSIDQDAMRTYRPYKKPDATPRIHPNQTVVTTPRTTTTVEANVNARKRSDWDNRNWTDRDRDRDKGRNKDWNNRVTTNNHSWEEARHRHQRNHHDRSWWRSRYNRFALFGSGYYFWDSGYWYPAYGYDSRYNSYSYAEPIYGYNDLDPEEVISTVQRKLQRLGYYRYAVDGQMGPATRAAIANYQRDTGISITAAIDEPTLQSLGLD